MPITVVIDTREQRPWCFDIWVAACLSRKLDWGDYALEGDEGFAIERKSVDDFAGTIGKGWNRFCREIDRSQQMAIIVEGDMADYMFTVNESGEMLPPTHHAQITPQFVRKRISELTLMGIPVLFAIDAGCAAALAQQILCDRAKELESDNASVSSVSSESGTRDGCRSSDTCLNCGGGMVGDGYLYVRACENYDTDGEGLEADAGPVYCEPDNAED